MVPCDFSIGGRPPVTLLLTHEQVQGLVPAVLTLCDPLTVKSIPTDLSKSELLCKVVAHGLRFLSAYWFLDSVIWNFYKILNVHNLNGVLILLL